MSIEGLGKDTASVVARKGAKALEKAAATAETALEKAGQETAEGLVKDVVKKTRMRKGRVPASEVDMTSGVKEAVRKTRARKTPEPVAPSPVPDLSKLGREERAHLAFDNTTADATLEALASDTDSYVRSCVEEAVMGRPESSLAKRLNQAQGGTSSADLIKLASDPAGMVRQEAAANKKLQPREIERLYKTAGDDLFVLLGIAANPKTPEAILSQLATRKEPELQMAVLHNLSAPRAAIERLARAFAGNSEHYVEMGFARHPHTPTALLERLAASENPNVMNALLYNPGATPEALRIAHRTPNSVYDKGPLLAKHKNIPPDVLDALARSGDEKSVLAAAAAQGTPEATLIALSKLDHHALMMALASNPSLPAEAALNLARSTNPNVSNSLLHNPATTAEALRVIHNTPVYPWSKGELLAKHRNAPPDLLDTLARSGDRESVVAAAGAKGTPAATLIELSKLDNFGLMEALASNPALPEEAALNLARCSYPNVLDRLLRNKVTSPEALRQIDANPAGVWDKEKLLLAHPLTPADVRAKLGK